MVPRYWKSLPDLPRNPAGKLDRSALPLPDTDRPDIGISLRAASTPLEELVVRTWCDVLGFTQAGLDDDFHAFGGSSVQAARILGRLRGVVRTHIPYDAFMSEATPAGLAGSISGRLGAAVANDVARTWATMQATRDDQSLKHYEDVLADANLDRAIELPAPTDTPSFGQKSLWFFQQLQPDCASYNLTFAYRLRGPLRLDALSAALNDVVAANESLRSAFVEKDGQPVVKVAPRDTCLVDPTTETITEQGIKDFVDQCARRPFDLSEAPLLRASIGSIGSDDNVLVLDVHHIVFDGWSRRLLLNQVAQSYWYHVQGAPQTALETFSYRAFSALQRSWMESDAAASSLDFWRERLSNINSPMPLPTTQPRPDTHPNTGHKQVQQIERDLSGCIDSFARDARSTPFVTLLVGIKLLLMSKHVEDLIVGVPFVNRDRPEFESSIGYFVNMVVVRSRYERTMSMRELVELETDVVNQAISHGNYPFDRLVSDLSVPRSLAHNPLYQVIFNLLGDEWDELSLKGVKSEVLTADNGASQVDLSVAARRSGGVYTLTWEYCDALFTAETITVWQQEYREILCKMTANPELGVDAVLTSVRALAEQRTKEASQASRTSRIDRLRKARSSTKTADAAANAQHRSRTISRAQRRRVDLSALTKEQALFDDLSVIKIETAVRSLDPVAWAADHGATIRDKLIHCGGILFRGFDIENATDFESFFRTVCGPLNEYTHRVTKRSQPGESFVYTSTDHPKTLDLALHNETSYTKQWPAQIGFYCDLPSREGGQTPIADSRRVLAALPKDLVARFSKNQLLYMRNSGNSIELPWKETFQTDDKTSVEEFCRSHDIEFEWTSNGELRTSQCCHVMARHPQTGDTIWFNQAHLMHRSAYPPGVIDRMFADTPDDELPFNVFFGDRTQIPDADVALINDTYSTHARTFLWQKGDVMILDNMLMAHGRRPFEGDRKILVAMAGTISAADVALVSTELE
jgi:alpha-ketoglutarate-dependent taurine dioxygenase